jgi:hypothetical protein
MYSTGRLQGHRSQCAGDHLACPLYRYAHATFGGMEGFTEQTVAEIRLPQDAVAAKRLLRGLEALVVRQLRGTDGVQLKNRNRPVGDQQRSARGKAWRDAHPGYMAAKGREWRAKRKRAARLAAQAQAPAAVQAAQRA